VGFGGQIGAEVTDFVVVLNSAEAVKAFSTGGQVTLGGNLSVAAGPSGRNAEADIAISNTAAPIFSYSKTRGLFAGVSVEGSVIMERKDANEKFYRQPVTARQLLSGAILPPPEATPLYVQLSARAAPLPPRPGQTMPPPPVMPKPQRVSQDYGHQPVAPVHAPTVGPKPDMLGPAATMAPPILTPKPTMPVLQHQPTMPVAEVKQQAQAYTATPPPYSADEYKAPVVEHPPPLAAKPTMPPAVAPEQPPMLYGAAEHPPFEHAPSPPTSMPVHTPPVRHDSYHPSQTSQVYPPLDTSVLSSHSSTQVYPPAPSQVSQVYPPQDTSVLSSHNTSQVYPSSQVSMHSAPSRHDSYHSAAPSQVSQVYPPSQVSQAYPPQDISHISQVSQVYPNHDVSAISHTTTMNQTMHSNYATVGAAAASTVSSSAYVETATAIYDFDGVQAGDLPFLAGDTIHVTRRTGSQQDWWNGTCKGKEGMFPANYVQLDH
jgi:hypothetical protein